MVKAVDYLINQWLYPKTIKLRHKCQYLNNVPSGYTNWTCSLESLPVGGNIRALS